MKSESGSLRNPKMENEPKKQENLTDKVNHIEEEN